jgi:hypothetical protein
MRSAKRNVQPFGYIFSGQKRVTEGHSFESRLGTPGNGTITASTQSGGECRSWPALVLDRSDVGIRVENSAPQISPIWEISVAATFIFTGIRTLRLENTPMFLFRLSDFNMPLISLKSRFNDRARQLSPRHAISLRRLAGSLIQRTALMFSHSFGLLRFCLLHVCPP